MLTCCLQFFKFIFYSSILCLFLHLESSCYEQKEFALISPSTHNEEAIIDQILTIEYPTTKQFFILDEFFTLDPIDQQIAINQLAALPYTNLFQMAEINTRKFLRRLYTPLRKVITINPEDRCGCISKYRIGAWGNIGYDKTNINTGDCFEGYHWNGCDATFGVQTSMTPTWTLGFAASYEHDKINYRLGAQGTNQTVLAGMYSLLRPADYYLLGDIVAGYGRYSVRRPVDIDAYCFHFQHKGKPQLYQGMAYLEGGKDLPIQGCRRTYLFQPFLGLELGYFRYHKLREKTDDPLFNIHIASKSHVTFSGRLGVHFTTQLSCFAVAVDAAWQHRCTSLHNNIKARFIEFGDPFSITGLNLSRDSFDGAVNLTLALEDNLNLYAEAAGQLWNHASTYNLFAGIQLGW